MVNADTICVSGIIAVFPSIDVENTAEEQKDNADEQREKDNEGKNLGKHMFTLNEIFQNTGKNLRGNVLYINL